MKKLEPTDIIHISPSLLIEGVEAVPIDRLREVLQSYMDEVLTESDEQELKERFGVLFKEVKP